VRASDAVPSAGLLACLHLASLTGARGARCVRRGGRGENMLIVLLGSGGASRAGGAHRRF